jgi:hypothetical protein
MTLVLQSYNNDEGVKMCLPLAQRRGFDVCVIDKNHSCFKYEKYTNVKCDQRENFGRDVEAFLYFVTANYYYMLPGVIVFSSANVTKWNRYARLESILYHEESFAGESEDELVTHEQFTIDEWLNEKLTPASSRPFWRWVDENIGAWEDVKRCNACYNCVFRTTRMLIQSRPKSFYEKLLQQLTVGKELEVVHYVERACKLVFGFGGLVLERKTQSPIHVFAYATDFNVHLNNFTNTATYFGYDYTILGFGDQSNTDYKQRARTYVSALKECVSQQIIITTAASDLIFINDVYNCIDKFELKSNNKHLPIIVGAQKNKMDLPGFVLGYAKNVLKFWESIEIDSFDTNYPQLQDNSAHFVKYLKDEEINDSSVAVHYSSASWNNDENEKYNTILRERCDTLINTCEVKFLATEPRSNEYLVLITLGTIVTCLLLFILRRVTGKDSPPTFELITQTSSKQF